MKLGILQTTYLSESRKLLLLILPMALSRLSFKLMSTIDTIFLGHYGTVGDIAYVSQAGAVQVPMWLASIGLLSGVAIKTSHAMGEKNYAKAGNCLISILPYAFILAIFSVVLCQFGKPYMEAMGYKTDLINGTDILLKIYGWGFFPFVFNYTFASWLEARNKAGVVTKVITIALCLNILLDFVFVSGIFFPTWGSIGVALATTLVKCFIFVNYVSYIFFFMNDRKKFDIHLKLKNWWKKSHDIRVMGFFMGLSAVADGLAFSIPIFMVGYLGTESASIFGLSFDVAYLLFTVLLTIGIATGIRIGNAYGASNSPLVVVVHNIGMFYFILFNILFAVLLIYCDNFILHIYTSKVDLIEKSAPLLAISWVLLVGDSLQVFFGSICRALNDKKITTIIQVTFYPVCVVGLCYLFTFTWKMKLMGLMWGMGLGYAIVGVLLAIYSYILYKKFKKSLIS